MFVAPFFVIVGIFINEHFRRKDKEALFSDRIFDKKLEIYENLHLKMQEFYIKAEDVINDKQLSKEEKIKEISPIIISIAVYLDENNLYINEDLAMHCMLTLVGIEDISSEKEISNFRKDRKITTQLIREEAGLKRLDKFYDKINKKETTSKYIEYIKELRKRYKTE